MHRIRVDVEAGCAVLVAEGELDAYVAPQLGESLAEAVTAPGTVIDLRAVSFLDSTALGLLVRAVREIGENGRQARIVLPRNAARRIFEITALDRVLPLAASREDAVAEVSRPG